MSLKFLNKVVLLVIFISGVCGVSYSQNPSRIEEAKESRCSKKIYCEDIWEDFDYRSQSSFGEFAPGDTLRAKIIVYSGQDYRIFACGDQKLGELQMKIIDPVKETKRVIKAINKRDTVEYKLDEYGNTAIDANGDPIVLSKKTLNDTIWERITNIKEKELFNSLNNKDNAQYWQKSITKTQRLVVEVVVPDGDKTQLECVNIYVGRMISKNKKMSSY